MKELGNHLIIEFYGCESAVINNRDVVEKILVEAADKANVTIIDRQFHSFSPHGVSGALIIAESHFTIHTWPEYKYCAVDIFTCGSLADKQTALEIIKKGLQATYYSAIEMKRGILDLPDEMIKHKPEDSHP